MSGERLELSLGGGRLLLLPVGPRRVRTGGLALYVPMSPRARLAHRAVTLASAAGVAPLAFGKVRLGERPETAVLLDGTFRATFERVTGCGPDRFAVLLGRPGPVRKPVIAALADDGRVRAYGKVGWNPLTRELVANEARQLRWMSAAGLATAIVPRVMHSGSAGELEVCFTEPIRFRPGRRRLCLTRLHVDFLLELAGEADVRETLAGSVFLAGLRRGIATLDEEAFPGETSTLARAVDAVAHRAGRVPVPFVRACGDFTPWNVDPEPAAGRLRLIDLEYGMEAAPAGWDLFHFLGFLRDGRRPWVGHEVQLGRYLAGLGLAESLIEPLYDCYRVGSYLEHRRHWKGTPLDERARRWFAGRLADLAG